MRRCRLAACFVYAYVFHGVLFARWHWKSLALRIGQRFPARTPICASGPSLRVRLRGHEPFEGKVLVPSLGTSKRFPSDIFDSAQIGKPPP